MIFAIQCVQIFFYIYTIVLVLAILLSWFPEAENYSIVRLIRSLADPYLKIFRRLIPPFGILDVSPIVAFLFLKFIQGLIVGLLLR